MITAAKVGKATTFKLLRDGKEITVKAEVPGGGDHLLCRRYHDTDFGPPCFAMVGGLVFVPFTGALYETLVGGEDHGGGSDVYLPGYIADNLGAFKEREGQQMVLLLRVLTHDVNVGYYASGSIKVLHSINGTKIENMAHLVEYATKTSEGEEYLKFRFGTRGSLDEESGELITLDRKAAFEAEPEILETHRIDIAVSRDLKHLLGDAKA
jgi:hypothetical protein